MQLVGQTVVYDAPAIAGFPAHPPNVQVLNFFLLFPVLSAMLLVL